MMTGGRHYSETHTGAVRSENQDALVCRSDIEVYALADGAGGHANGRLAANAVIAKIAELSPILPAPERLGAVRRGIAAAHQGLLAGDMLGCQGSGIAASTVAVLLLERGFFVCLWVGDSRIYLWRGGELFQLTRDHSLVQEMVDAGTLSPWEAQSHPSGNIITRAVGAGGATLQVEKRSGEILPGDRFLVCSDGLNKTMNDDEICQLLGGDGDPAAKMLEIALRRRARDNVSIIVVCRD